MKKLLLIFFFVPVLITAYSQTTPVLNLPKDAKIEGSVVRHAHQTTKK